MATQTNLSRLMRISWDIQRRKYTMTRSKALMAAWAILQNEEVTVQYLSRKLNHGKPVSERIAGQFVLFNQ
ncbi:MAG: hypothetical protein JWQ38_3623 [Flavipsychrobacter sp.]|nr:hypothetical protein [Flavipsychrobacter sp.]